MPVIDDPQADGRRETVTRLVLCSGKVAVDLEASNQRETAANVAVARVEQLAPFQNSALRAVIGQYPNLTEIAWLQEEPRNMGAWTYMEPRLRELTGGAIPIDYIGRPERASPAEGSAEAHADEQARIVSEAFANAPTVTGVKDGARKAHAVKNGAVEMPGANGQHRVAAKSDKTKTAKSRS
jgi:2-oxoglutarate dehydrogenase E1 component